MQGSQCSRKVYFLLQSHYGINEGSGWAGKDQDSTVLCTLKCFYTRYWQSTQHAIFFCILAETNLRWHSLKIVLSKQVPTKLKLFQISPLCLFWKILLLDAMWHHISPLIHCYRAQNLYLEVQKYSFFHLHFIIQSKWFIGNSPGRLNLTLHGHTPDDRHCALQIYVWNTGQVLTGLNAADLLDSICREMKWKLEVNCVLSQREDSDRWAFSLSAFRLLLEI